LLLALGMRVVGSKMVYAAGPGEVLINDSLKLTQETIDKLINYEDRPYESIRLDHCPIDYNRVFEHVEGNKFRCPVCMTPAILHGDGYEFRAEDLNNHRWTEMKLEDHFENWILKTKPRFKAMLREIMQEKKKLGL
jgi:hypothetical protein